MNKKYKPRTINFACWIALIGLFLTPSLHAQNNNSTNKDEIIVSYIYNFAKNIQWRNEAQLKRFNIGLFEVEDSGLVRRLEALSGEASVKNVPITVDRINSIDEFKNYQLIYTDTNNEVILRNIYNSAGSDSTLIVTSNIDNKNLVMINLFERNGKVQFEVNSANILIKSLKSLPDLILYGGTELDVAKLYRDGQASLITLEDRIKQQEQTNRQLSATLKNLNEDIKTSEQLNQSLEVQLRSLGKDIKNSQNIIQQQERAIDKAKDEQQALLAEIDSSNQKLAAQQVTLERQQGTLDTQQSTLNKQQRQLAEREQKLQQSNESINNQRQLLNQQQTIITGRQTKLDAISATITTKENQLRLLSETIGTQQVEISSQRDSIDALDKVVLEQKKALTYLYALIGLSLLFVIAALMAYRVKKKDNQKLFLRSRELQLARDKLEVEKRKAEAANNAKSQFLSIMSHELRTPLQSIIGYADVLTEELHLEGSDEYTDDLNRISSNGNRLLKMINNTLDLAKIEAGNMTLSIATMNMTKLVEEAINNIKPLMDANANKLIVDIDDNNISIEADYEKLLHVLLNLLSNANKFTAQGEIFLTVGHSDKQLQIKVRDTGIGLTKEQQDCIFTRFHQVDHGNTRKFKGTGLGLSITQEFCELMSGTITVESTPEQGASFFVHIPLPVRINSSKLLKKDVA